MLSVRAFRFRQVQASVRFIGSLAQRRLDLFLAEQAAQVQVRQSALHPVAVSSPITIALSHAKPPQPVLLLPSSTAPAAPLAAAEQPSTLSSDADGTVKTIHLTPDQLASAAWTPLKLAIDAGLAKDVVAVKVNGTLWDSTRPISEYLSGRTARPSLAATSTDTHSQLSHLRHLRPSLFPQPASSGSDQSETSHRLDIELLTFDHPDAKSVFWHSSAHILGAAIESVYGDDAALCDGPSIDEGGFFYDVLLAKGARSLSAGDLPKLSSEAARIAKQKHKFERLQVSARLALDLFRDNPFKTVFIERAIRQAAKDSTSPCVVTLYRCGDFVDLCRGPHLQHTGVGDIEFHKVSGVHWAWGESDAAGVAAGVAGSEALSLQRVYGISFPKSSQLKLFKHNRDEAGKRDHRVIGNTQSLFMFHPYSPGSAFMLPHGLRVISRLTEYIRWEYKRYGYQEVSTPLLYDKKLWETSGHWQHYAQDMFSVHEGVSAPSTSAAEPESGSNQQALKPMNCPGHCLIFDSHTHSYRDLPIRLADFSPLHRNEAKGALSGLTRVRRFHQDDAHIFCTAEQIKTEIVSALSFVKDVYSRLGFTSFSIRLSTRPDSYVGDVDQWNHAEECLAEALNETCGGEHGWSVNLKDGAFYGPKIDISIQDALGRAHQTATIQLDFQLPKRFGLKYTDADGQIKTPVIVHRAVLGSLERMFAILIENTAGKWPLWLSPRQVVVCTVSQQFAEYAGSVQRQLQEAFSAQLPGVSSGSSTTASGVSSNPFSPFRLSSAFSLQVDVDASDKRVSKKIFEAQHLQYNYILVVGAEEQAQQRVSVRARDAAGADLTSMTVNEFVAKLCHQVAAFR